MHCAEKKQDSSPCPDVQNSEQPSEKMKSNTEGASMTELNQENIWKVVQWSKGTRKTRQGEVNVETKSKFSILEEDVAKEVEKNQEVLVDVTNRENKFRMRQNSKSKGKKSTNNMNARQGHWVRKTQLNSKENRPGLVGVESGYTTENKVVSTDGPSKVNEDVKVLAHKLSETLNSTLNKPTPMEESIEETQRPGQTRDGFEATPPDPGPNDRISLKKNQNPTSQNAVPASPMNLDPKESHQSPATEDIRFVEILDKEDDGNSNKFGMDEEVVMEDLVDNAVSP